MVVLGRGNIFYERGTHVPPAIRNPKPETQQFDPRTPKHEALYVARLNQKPKPPNSQTGTLQPEFFDFLLRAPVETQTSNPKPKTKGQKPKPTFGFWLETDVWPFRISAPRPGEDPNPYRGTLFIRNRTPLGPYRRPML
jgi:hypothetical protein